MSFVHKSVITKRTRLPGGGGTPLYGLNGDVRPDRVWFPEDFVLNGVSISSIFVLNRVSLHDLMYSLTTHKWGVIF